MEEKEEFQVITETNSKQKNSVKRTRSFKKLLMSLLGGVLFGVAAAVTFGVVTHVFFERDAKENDRARLTLTSSDAEQTDEGAEEENVSSDGEASIEDETASNVEGETDEDASEGEATIEPTPIYITEEHTLSVEEYQVLYNRLINIGTGAYKSVVTVYHVEAYTDIFALTYENSSACEGLVIAKDDADLMVLTQSAFLQTEGESYVQAGDLYLPAEVVAESKTYGIAVLRADASALSSDKFENIEVATITPSTSTYTGRFVLAIGSSRGLPGEIILGAVSSLRAALPVTDGDISVIVTDIGGSSASGFLVNTNGYFIGMLLPHITDAVTESQVCGISLGELQPLLEKLLNGEEEVTVGLSVSDLTGSESGTMPGGVFVRGVALDSSAFMAGIQAGDIIAEVNGEEVTSVAEYEERLLSLGVSEDIVFTVYRETGDTYEEIEITMEEKGER